MNLQTPFSLTKAFFWFYTQSHVLFLLEIINWHPPFTIFAEDRHGLIGFKMYKGDMNFHELTS